MLFKRSSLGFSISHFLLAGVRLFFLATTTVLTFAFSSGAQAATAANAQSPLGLDLQGIAYYSTENPFINIFVNAGSWVTSSNSTYGTGEEAYLKLDSNGYPTSLVASSSDPHSQSFTFVQVPMFNALPSTPNGYYPWGQYIVTYQGAGTLRFAGDAKVVSSSPGQYVINVASPSATGIFLQITSTDPFRGGQLHPEHQRGQSRERGGFRGGADLQPCIPDYD